MSTAVTSMIDSLISWYRRFKSVRIHLPIVFATILMLTTSALAQDDSPSPTSVQPVIHITDIDASRMPMIQIQAYGRGAGGEAIDFGGRPVVVTHGDQTIDQVSVAGKTPEGTFTLFLVDTPVGVEGQLENINAAILSFAAEPFMREQTDHMAVYQVTGSGAEQLLEPTPFYNAVLNFFVDPLPVESGPTALYDSLGGLINEIDLLRPEPGMPVSIVVFSDGTDVVSTQFTENSLIETAANLGVPVHTVLVTNDNLAGSGIGGQFMSRLAGQTGGLGGVLTENAPDELSASLWARIATFRDQTILRYTLPNPAPGAAIPISVALTDNPGVRAEGTVAIPETAGFITIPLPPESRSLILPDVTQGVALAIPTEVRWLDGQERELVAAQLWVNNAPVVDLEPGNISPVEVTVTNLRAGPNEVWINGVDDIGQQIGGPILQLVVEQGDRREIPEALAPSNSFRWVWLTGCVALLGLMAAGIWWLWPSGRAPGGWAEKIRLPAFDFSTRPRRRSSKKDANADRAGSSLVRDSQQLTPAGHALDVMDSTTLLVSPIGLKRDQVRLGRSPNQADIVFDQDMTMSRLHASLSKEGQSYRLFDEGSTSGSFVNDQPVPQYGTLLMDGDELQLGAVRLRFRVVWDISSQL